MGWEPSLPLPKEHAVEIDCALLANFARLRLPATDEAIQAAQTAIGLRFPHQYISLLRCSDGCEPYNQGYCIGLFSTDEIADMNEAYHIQEYLPDHLFIGFDGGGRGIFLALDGSTEAVYLCHVGALDENLRLIAPDLNTWIGSNFDLQDPPDTDLPTPEMIDIYLVKAPAGGVKSLYKMAQALGLTVPMSALRDMIEQIPYRLIYRVKYGPYIRICARLYAQDPCLAVYESDRPEEQISLEDVV